MNTNKIIEHVKRNKKKIYTYQKSGEIRHEYGHRERKYFISELNLKAMSTV